jgi:deoxyribodipyrimidine photo-lyase
MTPFFPPTRAAALDRLAAFVPRAGRDYASGRNYDLGPGQPQNVSILSAYVRHRLLTEREIAATVLARHRFAAAEKYIQEVLWRTYWKGWLEMRPAVWQRFLAERDADRAAMARLTTNANCLAVAEAGQTGIEGFDDWARELVETNYLHNHARMWFASIWIFTLRLPWTLGADFFLRHLADADPASNTLSWRWVAGLQTAGKTYLANADNIARYTKGRFHPRGLAASAVALNEAPVPPARSVPLPATYDRNAPALLLITPEDLNPESLFATSGGFAQVLVALPDNATTPAAAAFAAAAAPDTAARATAAFRCPATILAAPDAAGLLAAADVADVRDIATPYAPTGSVSDWLAALGPELQRGGVTLTQHQRPWDTRFWPHAGKGFFPFREKLPRLLAEEGLC